MLQQQQLTVNHVIQRLQLVRGKLLSIHKMVTGALLIQVKLSLVVLKQKHVKQVTKKILWEYVVMGIKESCVDLVKQGILMMVLLNARNALLMHQILSKLLSYYYL